MGWLLLDKNPATSGIAASAGNLYQIHKKGAIWKYTGTPYTGWQQIDYNESLQQVVAAGGNLYQRRYKKKTYLLGLTIVASSIWQYVND